jgi:23S rRNA-/tRNA-specific pseudouridylate synthase
MKMLKSAITEYKPLMSFKYNGKPYTLLRVTPKTGRTHQIRVHLASIGRPIVGDSLYGRSSESLGLNRQFLHAESLELTLQNSHRIKIAADLPDDLSDVMIKLNGKSD